MLRPAVLLVFGFALQGALAMQVEHGAPASVLSPTSPGAAHGAPASVNSVNTPQGRAVFMNPNHPRVPFGNPRPRRTRHGSDLVPVPVPIFFPAYPLSGDPASQADDQDAEQAPGSAQSDDSGADQDALREAYYRGAHDALAQAQQRGDSRYGNHYLDSREKGQAAPPDKPQAAPADSQPDPPDNGPAAIFIFKDGHKLETQNYAIQGQTLFDFSNNQLKKIKLADLDLEATKKANDNLGITVRFPPSP